MQTDAIRKIGDGYFWKIDAKNMATLHHESGDECQVTLRMGQFLQCMRFRPGQMSLTFPVLAYTLHLPSEIKLSDDIPWMKEEAG